MSATASHADGYPAKVVAPSVNGPIFEAALQVARACRRKARELDGAFLKRADLRAVQGGAICEEAHAWRQRSEEAYRLAFLIEDQE